jgi:hypothetical protein
VLAGRRAPTCVPFLSGAQINEAQLNNAKLTDAQVLEARTCGIRSDEAEREWQRLSWNERCDQIIEAWRSTASPNTELHPPQVIAIEGPTCIPAALVAAYFGFGFHLIKEPFAKFLAEHTPFELPLILAGLPDDFPDQCLFSNLERFRLAIDQNLLFSSLPVFTLLCARNVEALSWVAAKWILEETARHQQESQKHFALFVPAAEGSIYQSLTLKKGQTHAERETYSAQHFASKAVESTDLLAVATHGFEACADGGGGVVLCGLNSILPTLKDGLPGVLACARGYDCPRGPQPIPLEKFQTRTLMVASCNGLRLADSVLQSHFNLGLSFVDGSGVSYISSLFSSAGTTAAGAVFAAAMAAGVNLSEALALVNAFLYRSKLDHPAYLAIGNPLHRLGPRSVATYIATGANNRLTIPSTDSNMADICVQSRALARLAASGRLCVRIVDHPGPVFWFSYAESEETFRLFLFAFPNSLAGLNELTFLDRIEIEQTAKSKLESLARWADFAESKIDSGLLDTVRQTQKEIGDALPSALQRHGYKTGALEPLSAQIQLLHELVLATRRDVIEALSPELLKTFWLSNSYSHRLLTERIEVAHCQNCGDPAVARVLRNPLTDRRRKCVVCPRCGITSDLALDDVIRRAVVIAPMTVSRETEWEMEVQLELNPNVSEGSALICPRLSANGWSDTLTDPPYEEIILDGATNYRTRFSQKVMESVPPHRYFLKVLIASESEIGFATRVIYVI